MIRSPRRAAILAVFLITLVGVARAVLAPPLIQPAQAVHYEGVTVRVEGLVQDVRVRPDGGASWRLVADGAAIPVWSEQVPGPGAWVQVEGEITRLHGRLILDASHLETTGIPPVPAVSLQEVVAQPEAWTQRPFSTDVRVEEGRVAYRGGWLDAQPRPADGDRTLIAHLDYQDACACYRLTVIEDRPWTP